jgi:hypothetical protein
MGDGIVTAAFLLGVAMIPSAYVQTRAADNAEMNAGVTPPLICPMKRGKPAGKT